MGRRKFGRPVDGVIVVDKPTGLTSNAVLQQVKRLFFAEKAGHTGSLDPLATGVLPICLGEATKFSQFLLDADKAYVSRFLLGQETDTADSDGKVTATRDASHITQAQVEALITQSQGLIYQVPPMYSALKRDGQPLYKLARKGIEVERDARPVTLYEYELTGFHPGKVAEVEVKVRCSKGTYIRSLAESLGQQLDVGGHVASLRRIQSGPFDLSAAYTPEALTEERGEGRAESLDHHLKGADIALAHLPRLELDLNGSGFFRHGHPVMVSQVYSLGEEGDKVRVFQMGGEFLGVGVIADDAKVAPKRLIAQ